MDADEAARRAACDPSLALDDATLERLFVNFPGIRAVDEGLRTLLDTEPGLDKDDADAWSFAWFYLRPLVSPRLARVFRVVGAVVCAGAAVGGVAALRRRMVLGELAALAVSVDAVCGAVFVGLALPVLMLGVFQRRPRHSDAPRRLVVGFALAAALWLPSAWALVASGAVLEGLVVGAGARLIALPAVLWFWEDLGRELFVMCRVKAMLVGKAVSAWRWAVTGTVLLGGGALRALAAWGKEDGWGRLVRSAMVERAVDWRLRAVGRFPVALSLLADTGGLLFMAGVAVFLCCMYSVYVAVFVSDFFRQRFQRKTKNVLVEAMIRRQIFLPNIVEERKLLQRTAPPGVKAHFAHPAMMLKRPPRDEWAGGTFLQENKPPRILQLLEDEEVTMKEKGMNRWMSPRDQYVPVTDVMSERRRSEMALERWARPLQPEDGDKGFADFFDSVMNEEYEFDPETDNFVFTDQMQTSLNDEDGETEEGDERTLRNGVGEEGGESGSQGDGVSAPKPVVQFRFPDIDSVDAEGTVV